MMSSKYSLKAYFDATCPEGRYSQLDKLKMNKLKQLKTVYDIGENFASGTAFNFLANENSIYVIDNHLAAFWCWAKLPQKESYKLIHIDQHYDANQIYHGTENIIKSTDWQNLPIEKLTDISLAEESLNRQVLFWDNYICCYNTFNPTFFDKVYFYTHGVGDFQYEGKNEQFEYERIFQFNFKNNSNYLLSLDLDVFFEEDYDRQIYSDTKIKKFGKWLSVNKERFSQIVISLTPDYCGGWSNSKRIANIILNEIKYKL